MTLEEFEDANLGQPLTKEDWLVTWLRCYLSQSGGNMLWPDGRQDELWKHFQKWVGQSEDWDLTEEFMLK